MAPMMFLNVRCFTAIGFEVLKLFFFTRKCVWVTRNGRYGRYMTFTMFIQMSDVLIQCKQMTRMSKPSFFIFCNCKC